MSILSGDIKLMASQVMLDTPEGGGAPTATAVADGVSNAIFPDVSELDRAMGRVALRKLHVTVATDNTDTYMGTNVIVAEPPADPNISVSLFTTGNSFDRRADAVMRVEAYLNASQLWYGNLLEKHISGQRVMQIIQPPDTELPGVGKTLVLRQYEGLPTERTQYVRTTSTSYTVRTYYDQNGKPHPMWIVSCQISDALRYDFDGIAGGFDTKPGPNNAVVRDTTVADAGSYVGVVPLTSPASIGDFTAQAASIYTQLVPSAQTETPLSDLRTNGLTAAFVPTGEAITRTLALAFGPAQSMQVGGPIMPASLSVSRGGVTLTDKAGELMQGNTSVGTVDYENGILALASAVWGSAGEFAVTFVPAQVPQVITDQRALYVSAESRSQSYVLTLSDLPVPKSIVVSYLAQGRWYVLRDDGSGTIKGSNSAYGVGTISYATGAFVVTLGALPDVGSYVLIQSACAASMAPTSNTTLRANAHVYVPINSDGATDGSNGSKALVPGNVALSWTAHDGSSKTATDNRHGALTGDATGTVDYAHGLVLFAPNELPEVGAQVSFAHRHAVLTPFDGQGQTSGNLGVAVVPGTFSFRAGVLVQYRATHGGKPTQLNAAKRSTWLRVHDDGAGVLVGDIEGSTFVYGTLDYATGAYASTTDYKLATDDPSGPMVFFGTPVSYGIAWNQYGGAKERSYSYDQADSVCVYAATTSVVANPITATVNAFYATTVMVPNYVLRGVSFQLGSTVFMQTTDNTLVRDPTPTTGVGTPAGMVLPALGEVVIEAWTAGAPSAISDWRGVIAPPTEGLSAPFCAPSTIFRTSASPLRPGSVSVLGTLQDGTTFNVTASTDGTINGTRVKGRVDYQYGAIELYFVNPAGEAALNVDLNHLSIGGLTSVPADLVRLPTLRYNAVAYSYLPLDANLLGIDPVRLPSDGRVPIFRAGGLAVLGHTAKITATVANGQTVNCARTRLARVRVVGADGTVITTGYSADLDAGTVTFTNVAGYSQPITIEHRVEDMAVVRDAQIGGEISFTRALTHDYPASGSYVSSALVAGDLKSRVSVLFDQATWTGVWADSVAGTPATGTFNDALAPIIVTNRGAVTERWALTFTSTTAFNVMGEHVGVIALGNINAECAPLNPATGVPYFTLPALGWGSGWAAGNVLRFNTVGAMTPIWVVRTVQQGPNTGTEHAFTILSRGDVDRP